MTDATTLEPGIDRRSDAAQPLQLLIACIRGEPGGSLARAGTPLTPDGVFGRGDGDGSEPRCALAPALASPHLSRRQLRVAHAGARLHVENLGRATLRHNGRPTAQATLASGDVLTLDDVAVFVAAPWQPGVDGSADGLVGQSPAMGALLERLAFTARQRGHVLVLGPSGAGKERVAQALHRRSGRAGPLVARNAATIPQSLLDVELFGHVKNYPNPGMVERGGLVGEADGGTLFLDEIGEIDDAMQAHLLRLLDSGEYQRLGDPKTRRADLRVIAATNRSEFELKPDLRARFRHVLRVPPLCDRRGDIPLLLDHLARRAFAESPELTRFAPRGGPEVHPDFVAALLTAPLPLQVRELDVLLWESFAESPGDTLLPPPSLTEAAETADPAAATEWDDVTPERAQDALARCDGSVERAARELGLRNRYVLRRLLKKWGVTA